MERAIYEKARQIAQNYAKNVMVPAIKKQMMLNNYVATGMFSELLYARAIKSADYIVDVMFISAKKGSRFVQGKHHQISTGLSPAQYGGMVEPIKKWAEVRNIIFYKKYSTKTEIINGKRKVVGIRRKIGKRLTSKEVAFAIVNKYKKSGRRVPNERFITDIVINQYKDGLIKAIKEGLKDTKIEI